MQAHICATYMPWSVATILYDPPLRRKRSFASHASQTELSKLIIMNVHSFRRYSVAVELIELSLLSLPIDDTQSLKFDTSVLRKVVTLTTWAELRMMSF